MEQEDVALHRRNKWTFSVGTIGRDMIYTFMAMYLPFYLTDILDLPDDVYAWVAALMLFTRLIDAVLDIVMGSIVDNTRTRWGHYKPWILGGVVASALFTLLVFSDLGLEGVAFIVVFELIYLGWSLSWTANDIPYWSLLPAFTLDQKRREQIGSLAKFFASIGQFSVAVAVIPVTKDVLTPIFGAKTAWFIFAAIIVAIMLLGQTVTLVGTKVPDLIVDQQRVRVRDLAEVVFRNDQLLWTTLAMVLFMTGYTTTVTFGTYFFKYVMLDENMYAPFAAVLGVSQLTGFLIFPLLRRRFSRRVLYTAATALIVVGYAVFFLSSNIIPIAVAAVLIFLGAAFVIALMLVFLTDTIDYGHWKLGHRNTAATFALQPFINKVGAALSAGIVALTVIVSGISHNTETPQLVTDEGRLVLRLVMLILPLVLVVVGYLIYRTKYRIDEAFHAQIIGELRDRGQLVETDLR